MLIVAISIGGIVSFSSNPSIGPPTDVLLMLGAKFTPFIKQGQVWRFVTPVFLHAGFGMAMEAQWGMQRFIFLSFISGIGGTLLSCPALPDAVGVGASSSIMGLMGCFLMEIVYTWPFTEPSARKLNLIQVCVMTALIMLISFSPLIDFAAHLGGWIVGVFIGMGYFAQTRSTKFKKISIILCIVFLASYFAICLTVLYAT